MVKGLLEKTKEWIADVGLDKFAHFGIGGLLSAMVAIPLLLGGWAGDAPHALLAVTIGAAVTLILSVAKEVADGRLGGVYDWRDIEAAMFGSFFVCLSAFLGLLLWGAWR